MLSSSGAVVSDPSLREDGTVKRFVTEDLFQSHGRPKACSQAIGLIAERRFNLGISVNREPL